MGPVNTHALSAGTLVATIDRHSLFVWRAGREISQPLNLHHTKPYTVSILAGCEKREAVCSQCVGTVRNVTHGGQPLNLHHTKPHTHTP